eukprot:1185143-Prorocentrum_minimum.AAC.2
MAFPQAFQEALLLCLDIFVGEQGKKDKDYQTAGKQAKEVQRGYRPRCKRDERRGLMATLHRDDSQLEALEQSNWNAKTLRHQMGLVYGDLKMFGEYAQLCMSCRRIPGPHTLHICVSDASHTAPPAVKRGTEWAGDGIMRGKMLSQAFANAGVLCSNAGTGVRIHS